MFVGVRNPGKGGEKESFLFCSRIRRKKIEREQGQEKTRFLGAQNRITSGLSRSKTSLSRPFRTFLPCRFFAQCKPIRAISTGNTVSKLFLPPPPVSFFRVLIGFSALVLQRWIFLHFISFMKSWKPSWAGSLFSSSRANYKQEISLHSEIESFLLRMTVWFILLLIFSIILYYRLCEDAQRSYFYPESNFVKKYRPIEKLIFCFSHLCSLIFFQLFLYFWHTCRDSEMREKWAKLEITSDDFFQVFFEAFSHCLWSDLNYSHRQRLDKLR